MNVFPIGEYIRQGRLDQKLTQEKLCEGICEVPTLSRLENGTQTPSRNRVIALLQRLGLPEDRFYALLTPDEMEVAVLQKEVSAASVWYSGREGEEKRQAREEGLAKLKELEQITKSDDKITQQYILCMRIIFGAPEGDYPPKEQLPMLMEAIRMTVPKFDLEEINGRLYSIDETRIIDRIADAYSRSGDHDKAADIYNQLLKYVDKHYQQITLSAGYIPLITNNYAITLGHCKRYEKAIEIAERGWEACVKRVEYRFLPSLIHTMAECYYYLGDLEKSKKLYYNAYYVYKAIGEKHNCDILERETKEHFDIEFEN